MLLIEDSCEQRFNTRQNCSFMGRQSSNSFFICLADYSFLLLYIQTGCVCRFDLFSALDVGTAWDNPGFIHCAV